MTEFIITDHAIEQFIRRWESNKNSEDAKKDLLLLLQTSKNIGKRYKGASIFVSGMRPEVRMVVKDKYCITVLPRKNETTVGTEPIPQVATFVDEFRERIKFLSDIIPEHEEKVKNYEVKIQDIAEKRKALTAEKLELDNKKKELEDRKKVFLREIVLLKNELQELEKQVSEKEEEDV